MGRLDGKVAIVTGGGSGIGQASALALAKNGARVVVADVDVTGGETTVALGREAGCEVVFWHTDVGESASVAALVQMTVARFGGLDVLVNNVGIAVGGSVTETSEDDWNRVININLTSVWRGLKYAIPEMQRRKGGSIINISSVQSLIGFRGWAAYAASKGGINSLTMQAATEYGGDNIRVNAVAPGAILTPLNERLIAQLPPNEQQSMLELWRRQHALRRPGLAEEVAAMVVFLASDESAFVTGTIIRVDGGMVSKAQD